MVVTSLVPLWLHFLVQPDDQGESLSDSDGEDEDLKDGQGQGDEDGDGEEDEEDGFVVPDGYLSDDEVGYETWARRLPAFHVQIGPGNSLLCPVTSFIMSDCRRAE